jgi:ATP-dependent helicase/nuclease subunit B
MNLAAFPPESAFLPALAQAWLAAGGEPADGLLILPNRRAARAAAGAFLAANQGHPLLLPRIIALGALDEAALTLRGALDLQPAVPAHTRQAILTRLILARGGANGAPTKLHTAWALAKNLAELLDEAGESEIDFSAALKHIVPADFARHWQTTLDFLDIVTHAWPKILAEMGFLDPATRQAKLLDAQVAFWSAEQPAQRIWLAAAQGSPALARLAKIIAGLRNGAVILPGFDVLLPEANWEAISDVHAQSGIARLLTAMGARPGDVKIWPAPDSSVPATRTRILSEALLPAAHLTAWQQQRAAMPEKFWRLAARDEAEEALAIAMILRDALETPGRTAALITPDRGQAERVAAILARFGVFADDSAGQRLADTPPAILLRLLARAAATEFSPVPLLALLKHPLAAGGEPPKIFRRHARALERAALRGPRPPPGFDGIKYRLDQHSERTGAERNFLARLEILVRPAVLAKTVQPAKALKNLLQAGEALAASDQESGAARLWSGEAGATLAEFLAELLPVLETLNDFAAADLPDFLDALLEGAVVRKPRTKENHPRIAIWGTPESVLQTVDVAVLGGLLEGVWPENPDSGPWVSRPMRKDAGLPSPEQRIGFSAHDFFSLCARCETVVLAAPQRRDRAPAIPARWLTRLEARLAAALPLHPAAAWAAALDQPVSRERRPKPAPRPPASARPKKLSISDIATLIADPYAIYAKRILGLWELDPIDEESDASQFGDIVHAGLHAYFAGNPDFYAQDAAENLTRDLVLAMRKTRPRAALEHWWEARLARIAAWVVETERPRRRGKLPPIALALEIKAELPVGRQFTLTGRADRIERRADNTVFIADYKTGTPPSAKAILDGTAPQLPLEAVMAEAGAFGPEFAAPVTELAFWRLSGRHAAGEEKELFANRPDELRAAIGLAAYNLPLLVAKFADSATPYLARPHPQRATYADPYAGLSRRAEWEAEDDGD